MAQYDFEADAKAEAEALAHANRFKDTLIGAMGTQKGRLFIATLLDSQPPLLVDCISDPVTNGFVAGRRSITAGILALLIEECPDLYKLMNQESKEIYDVRS